MRVRRRPCGRARPTEVDVFVFSAVLVAAACHAGWNALIKLGLDPFTTMALIAVGAGVIAFPLVPVFGVPEPAAWPWLIASVILHIGYYLGLTAAYRNGDMGQVYPIARGTAPLLTAIGSFVVVGERLEPLAWAGIAALGFGILLMSMRGGKESARFEARAVGFALFTALTITGYSIVDGTGARMAGSAHAYTMMLFTLDGIAMGALALFHRRTFFTHDARLYWRSGLAGGGMSLIAYGIAIWAMTKAPIALVAALRESSVLFAALIAVVFLREPLHAVRLGAAAMIVAGLVLIRIH